MAELFTYPSNIAAGEVDGYQNFMVFTRHKHEGYSSDQLTRPDDYKYETEVGNTIALPVPDTLYDDYQINWSNEGDMTLGGEVLKNLANKIVPEKLRNLSTFKTGQIMEKHSAMLFQGVNNRRHALTWELIPHNANEAENIGKIIREFREAALPSAKTSSNGESITDGFFLSFPDIIQVKIVGNFGLMKFLPCVITGVQTNYTPLSMFTPYEDGNLPIIQLTVTLEEITNLTRESYQGLFEES